MTLNNKVYNVLKWIALIALPALSTLVMALGDIWGLPYKEQISLTIAAVDTFIGVLLGFSSASYKGEGKLVVDPASDQFVALLNDENTLTNAQKDGHILLTVETVDAIPDPAPIGKAAPATV